MGKGPGEGSRGRETEETEREGKRPAGNTWREEEGEGREEQEDMMKMLEEILCCKDADPVVLM